MPISIAQLNTLAQHYGFDINEARQLIGLPVSKPNTSTSTKLATKSSKPRGKTGYNLYCADCKPRVESALKSEKGVSKLARGELVSEMSRRWKQLPDSTREMWNQRAATI